MSGTVTIGPQKSKVTQTISKIVLKLNVTKIEIIPINMLNNFATLNLVLSFNCGNNGVTISLLKLMLALFIYESAVDIISDNKPTSTSPLKPKGTILSTIYEKVTSGFKFGFSIRILIVIKPIIVKKQYLKLLNY